MPLPTHHRRWQGVSVAGSSDVPGPNTGWQRVSATRTQTVTYLPVWKDTPACMRFVLNSGDDPINSSGVRCEWSGSTSEGSGGGESSGDSGVYAIAFYLPSGPGKNVGDLKWALTGSWAILWQLHHPGGSGSPPFGVRADQGWGKYPGGKLFLDTRGAGSEVHTEIHPTIPLDQWIRLIFEVRWGRNGWVRCHKRIGQATDWTVAFEKNLGTYYDGDGGGYWKGGGYFGDGRPNSTWYHGGMARVQTVDEAKGLYLGAGTTPPPPPPDDTTGPVVSVQAPTTGTVIANRMLTWMVQASDPAGVAEVTIGVGQTTIAREVMSPFGDGSPVLIPDAIANGVYEMWVKAKDTKGNTTTVSVPNVTIGTLAPPPPTMMVGTKDNYDIAVREVTESANRARAIATNYTEPNLVDKISSVANACDNARTALETFQEQ